MACGLDASGVQRDNLFVLELLKIRNVAVIDETEIRFHEGLNVLSGETGAGKSIVIESIALLLGGRASTDWIRTGKDEAVIEGVFDLSEIPWMSERLRTFGFTVDSDELMIKRSVHRSGKHRIYVNGELATLSVLQQLCDGLIDLCGQHEHQSLVKPTIQMDLLDQYGSTAEKANGLKGILAEYRSLLNESLAIRSRAEADAQKEDFLRFQIQELQSAHLQSGEDEGLHTEKEFLQSTESRRQLAESARLALESDEVDSAGAIQAIRNAISKVRQLSQLDEKIAKEKKFDEALSRALAEAEDVALELNRYLSSAGGDSQRLGEIQDRLSQIADLRRKYGGTVDQMVETLHRLEEEYQTLNSSEDRLIEIEKKRDLLKTDLQRLGADLSKRRRSASKLLSDSVTGELADLNMSDARFEVTLNSSGDCDSWSPALGPDEVQFRVRTNAGEELKPLGKIASGGELSRLLLSIRRVVSDKGGIGVYLFDEIDAGIGGKTAVQVGKKLKSVSKFNQVICITHLPQVASFADHHLSVRKRTEKNRTLTEVIELTQAQRKDELTRMMGGPELSKMLREKSSNSPL